MNSPADHSKAAWFRTLQSLPFLSVLLSALKFSDVTITLKVTWYNGAVVPDYETSHHKKKFGGRRSSRKCVLGFVTCFLHPWVKNPRFSLVKRLVGLENLSGRGS